MQDKFKSKIKILQTKMNILKNNNDISIFGTGDFAKKVYNKLVQEQFNVVNFFDNNSSLQGKKLFNLDILSPDMIDCNTSKIVIASSWTQEISKQLKTLNVEFFVLDPWFETCAKFSLNNDDMDILYSLYNNLADEESKETLLSIINYRIDATPLLQSNYEQYFHKYIYPEENDILIDGGSYDGDTIRALKKRNIKNLEVHCFEPDVSNYTKLESESNNSSFKICINNLGLWNDNTTLKFSSSNETIGYGCKIKDEGDISINTTSIDNYCVEHNIKPTYIKLDVEGAEYNTLIGAKKIISEETPKLAVSVYHKYKDLWELYNLINSINPNYEFYLGQHRDNWFETILYARKKES